jgi:hypothetical protein
MERDEMSDGLIYPNGVNGLTGEYLLRPVEPSRVAALAREPAEDPDLARELAQLGEWIQQPTFGLPFNVRPEDVSEVGWAIVFASDETDPVRDALAPLIEHRRSRLGDDRVKVLDHRPGEGWQDWLVRHRTTPGNVDPRRVPYYVLLVGGPARIPFEFQYLLDVEYAVGRLHFDDAGGYKRYVSSLIDYERARGSPREPTAAFFATRHPFDIATQLSADLLVRPLADSFRPGGRFADAVPGYRIDADILAGSATKARLVEVMDGSTGRPAVLFAATHGMGGWPAGHPDQAARHGALLCQDWPGLGQVDPAHYFAADDVTSGARLQGMVAFLFACYGAGTPEVDPFGRQPSQPPVRIADAPFVAALPQRLLAHPEGGALAVIGHIERAWGYSFLSGGEAHLLPFQNAVGRILAGQPVGLAMKDFNEKYAVLSANVSHIVGQLEFGRLIPDTELARLWTERTDAQNYVVLGDPAVALKPA